MCIIHVLVSKILGGLQPPQPPLSYAYVLNGVSKSSTAPIQLIEGCLFLESHLGLLGLVDRVREDSITGVILKKAILRKDKETLLASSLEHVSTCMASRIAEESSWLKLWDMAMDWGPAGRAALYSVFTKRWQDPHGSHHPACYAKNVQHLINLTSNILSQHILA